MTRPVRRLLVALVVLAAGAAAVYWFTRAQPVVVAVAAVERGRVEATVTNTRAGTIKACRRARLAPSSGGQIARLTVREGDRVAAGDTLLELWNKDRRAQVELALSEAAASRANVEQACLLAEQAEREAARLTALRERQLASEESADQAATRAKAQRASCAAARAGAEVSAARLAVARAAVEPTVLQAPFAGTVAEVNGEIGEFVTPSPTGVPTLPAVDLIDTACLYVSAPIDEVDAPGIRTGMSARISLDAFAGRPFAGRVKRIAPYVLEVEKQARTVDVEVSFDDRADFAPLLPGYSADIEVILDFHEGVVRIPSDAILEGARVLVFRAADGRIEERRITTGLANWRYTEVLSGLETGELLVTSVDREGVRAGALARAEEPGAPGAGR